MMGGCCRDKTRVLTLQRQDTCAGTRVVLFRPGDRPRLSQTPPGGIRDDEGRETVRGAVGGPVDTP